MHRKQWHANRTQKYKAYLQIIFKSQHSQSNGRIEITTCPRCRWQNPRQTVPTNKKSPFWSVGLETSPERPLAYYITIWLRAKHWAKKIVSDGEPSIRLWLTIDLRWQTDLLFARILFSYLDNHSLLAQGSDLFSFCTRVQAQYGGRGTPLFRLQEKP